MKVTATIAMLMQGTQAWWNNGHLITARIAYDTLLEKSPEVIKKAEAYL